MLGGLHLGRYRLLERLATGGMAEIYLAEQTADSGLTRRVVIKTILPQFTADPAMRSMLLDEARLGFALQHRNIVQVGDVGDQDELLYIAMEYVEGANLAEVCEASASRDGASRDGASADGASAGSASALGLGLVLHIGLEVLAALDYAHTFTRDGAPLDVVHRDVSPQNILVSTAGEVKLSDFGIALAKDRITKTTLGGVKGKLAYIPPEQATGAPVDASADIFSIAAVLYELLTGEGLYGATSDIAILKAMNDGRIGRLSEVRPNLPEGVSHAIDNALSLVPGQRPSASELRVALEKHAIPSSRAEKELAAHIAHTRIVLAEKADTQRRFERVLLEQSGGRSQGASVPTLRAVGGKRKRRVARAILGGAALLAGGLGVGVFLYPKAAQKESTPLASIRENAPLQADASTSVANRPLPSSQAPPVADLAPQLAAVPPVAAPPELPPREPTKRTKKTPAIHGRLTITAFPWAEVEVDGKKVGNTPIRNLSLRPGRHKVVLRNPQSGKSVQRRVTVQSGKSATLRIDL